MVFNNETQVLMAKGDVACMRRAHIIVLVSLLISSFFFQETGGLEGLMTESAGFHDGILVVS